MELWRAGDSVIGLLLASAGLDGDAPIGILEDVQFDSHSGSLSFRAKLTMGAALVAGGSQQPSQDLFEFSGVLRAKRLAAILTHCDPRRAESGERAMVRLTLQPKRDMLQAASYSEWKVLVEPILQARDRSGSHRRHGISYRRS